MVPFQRLHGCGFWYTFWWLESEIQSNPHGDMALPHGFPEPGGRGAENPGGNARRSLVDTILFVMVNT